LASFKCRPKSNRIDLGNITNSDRLKVALNYRVARVVRTAGMGEAWPGRVRNDLKFNWFVSQKDRWSD
jgi:hypothetical protein